MKRAVFLLSTVIATPAAADVPAVLTDIAPIHSLVSMVMEGVGEPGLIMDGAASPHDYALKPSDARALQDADILIWVGQPLTPWLADARETLGDAGSDLALLAAGPTRRLEARETLTFGEEHDHEHDHDHDHDDHGHADHANAKDAHDHEDHGHEEHDHAEHGHDDHAHGDDHDHTKVDLSNVDPHAWLDPENAGTWLGLIADALSDKDPENAATYMANAAAATDELASLQATISTSLAGTEIQGFAVYHDAFQYFETAFGVTTLASLSSSDAAQPSAARAAILQTAIDEGRVTCVFSEPQYADRALRSVADGTSTRVAVLDPLGADIPPGPALYPTILEDLANAIQEC